MHYLICGYYYHNNLGDDLFYDALTQLFLNDTLTFIDLSTINLYNLDAYDGIIIGGGDLMNDYYGEKYEEVLCKFTGYKAAIGVGFSFLDCTKRKYITYFDDIFIRNKTDLSAVSKYIGSQHTHSIPDLVFSLKLPQKRETIANSVGLFLVGSLISNSCFMDSISQLINWLIILKYQIHLIPMCTDKLDQNNDLAINLALYKQFRHTNMIINHEAQKPEEFCLLLSSMDIAVALRFHSHILCTYYGIGFLSIPITRKDEIFVSELPNNAQIKVKIHNGSFDILDAKVQFRNIIDNKAEISAALLNISGKYTEFFEHGKIQQIVANKRKRLIAPCEHLTIEPEIIYKKYHKLILSGIQSEELATNLCYDLTYDTANEYVYGTKINLANNPEKLHDIVYYIYDDYCKNVYLPKFNMTYIKQDSFRGLHRSGWHFATNSLYCQSGNSGILLDTYLDRTFNWASETLKQAGILPYTNEWAGFIHHTFNTEYGPNNCVNMFANKLFIASLPLCRIIYCLSEYLATRIRKKLLSIGYNKISVIVLTHPTEFPANKFTMEKYLANQQKYLVNIGAWYRNPATIYTLPPNNIKYAALKGKHMEGNFCPENVKIKIIDGKYVCDANIWTKYMVKYVNSIGYKLGNNFDEFLRNVTILSTMSNEDYDNLLSCNLVFLDLVDASAVNTIIECIVRNTPLIIRNIPPVVEALGELYPLYFNDISEIPRLLENDKILLAHKYLKKMDKSKYRIENFVL